MPKTSVLVGISGGFLNVSAPAGLRKSSAKQKIATGRPKILDERNRIFDPAAGSLLTPVIYHDTASPLDKGILAGRRLAF
jgi:hypothetical protein